MRISDWSSDVCSSDLRPVGGSDAHPLQHPLPHAGPWQGNDRSADGPVSPAGRRPDAFVLIGYSPLGKKSMTNPIEHRGPEGANFWSTEERRGGKEIVSQCRSRSTTYPSKKT